MNGPRHTSRGVVMHNGNILLIERHRGNLHYFSIPGGGIESGETPEETVIREIAEETSCVVELMRPLYVYTTDTRRHHIFLCRYISGTPHLPADSPEALEYHSRNRFDPTWVRLKEMRADKFFIWRPVIERLRADLENGFDKNVVEIAES